MTHEVWRKCAVRVTQLVSASVTDASVWATVSKLSQPRIVNSTTFHPRASAHVKSPLEGASAQLSLLSTNSTQRSMWLRRRMRWTQWAILSTSSFPDEFLIRAASATLLSVKRMTCRPWPSRDKVAVGSRVARTKMVAESQLTSTVTVKASQNS